MYGTIAFQTYVGLGLTAFILLIGLFLIFSKPEEKIVVKKVREKSKKLNLEGLDRDEKKIIELIQKENGGMFQRTLMETLGLGKVKVTRLLDKLESNELKTLKGVVNVKYSFPNNFEVQYGKSQASPNNILGLEVFGEYPATLISDS